MTTEDREYIAFCKGVMVGFGICILIAVVQVLIG